MKMTYFDEYTPEEYEPEFFRAADRSSSYPAYRASFRYSLGYHFLSFFVKELIVLRLLDSFLGDLYLFEDLATDIRVGRLDTPYHAVCIVQPSF